jgi:aspartate aminotransferase-like enzyme
MVRENLNKIGKLMGNPLEDHTIYLTCSGSGAMEAVVENCLDCRDRVLVVDGGVFGERFCSLLHHHRITFSSINLRWNEKLEYSHFAPFENKGYTALLINLCETSSGQLYDIGLVSSFCKRNDLLLVVDAISTFLADKYNMQDMGIDVSIVTSQKGLALSPPSKAFFLFTKRIENIREGIILQIRARYSSFERYYFYVTKSH